MNKIQILGALSVLAFACEPKIDTPAPATNGAIDVSNYVSIGNSITAGYADNGLYLAGQQVGYAVLLAEQFKQAGGGEFNAPLFDASQADGTGYLRLDGFTTDKLPILTSVPPSAAAIQGKTAAAYDPLLNPDSIVLQPYNGPKNHNFGVPGIRVKDIYTVGYGVKNPYFGRMLTDAEKPVFDYGTKVVDQKPTFFTSWLGNNDVLGYSTAGGYVDLGKITAASEFESNYTLLVNKLTPNPEVKGAMGNIPDVTSLPFFTTVGPTVKSNLVKAGVPAFYEFKFDSNFIATIIPILTDPDPNVVILTPSKLVVSLVSNIAAPSLTGAIEGKVFLTLTFSPYAAQIGTPRGTAWRDIIRTLLKTSGLPASYESLVWAKSGIDTLQPFGLSPKNPIPDVFVLNANESGKAKSAVASYNKIISKIADSKGLAYVDANTFLSNITKGSYYDAISTSASFISGGVFSLDGVHLTPRGNALAANEFIKSINGKYGTKITVVNPGKYPGVKFP